MKEEYLNAEPIGHGYLLLATQEAYNDPIIEKQVACSIIKREEGIPGDTLTLRYKNHNGEISVIKIEENNPIFSRTIHTKTIPFLKED
jgi:hypothetical protein